MPTKSRNNAPEAMLPPPPPPQDGPASHSAGRGKRQFKQPPSANPFEFHPPPPEDRSSGRPLTAANFPPVSIAHSAGRKPQRKDSRSPNNQFAHLPAPPHDKRDGRPLPSPPLYKGDGISLYDQPPAPAANIRIVPLPAGFLSRPAKQGAPKKANGRRNKRNNQPPSAGPPFMYAPPPPPQGKPHPHPHQRSKPTSGATQEEIHWEGADDSFYGALPVSHTPAPRKAVHHGPPAARRQSSIASSASSRASDNSFASALTDHTTLEEEVFVDFVGNNMNESLIKVNTKKSPRTGTSTQINIQPLTLGKIHHTVSRLTPKSKGRRAPF